jgi:AraC-like DNA-binding protein
MNAAVVYSIGQVAAMMGLSRQTVTRLFAGVEGVLLLERVKPEGKYKHYRTIRIPANVYERFVRKHLRVS